jgi:hypothetical protein
MNFFLSGCGTRILVRGETGAGKIDSRFNMRPYIVFIVGSGSTFPY